MSEFLTIDPRRAGLLARESSAIMVRDITVKTAMHARFIAPGTMKEHIRPIITGGANPLGIVVCDHPAAIFVLGGTKGHWISPKPGGVLRFEVGGEIVFTKKPVWHKPMKPNNFLMKAMLSARGA